MRYTIHRHRLRELLREKQKKLKEQEAQFNLEKIKTAESLGAILMPDYRLLCLSMKKLRRRKNLPTRRLKELHENIKQRVKDGEEDTRK
ncbi:hypothetical protein [Ruminococcus albus]|uniref:hypothetical protein n=1 Tax=Ruminococcus albus TaxID=1264 RepID=UPI0004B63829|nr:hypothetical protein [Ruminococcus albus]